MVLQKTNESFDLIQQGEVPKGYHKTKKYGFVPTDWKVKKIGEIFNRVRNPVDVNESEYYRQIGIKSHGKGIFYKDAVTGENLGNKSVFWVEPDCFIVNIVFAWETAVARTTKNELGFIASHRFPMYKPVDRVLDLDYITNLFKSPRGKHLLNLASPGGAGRNKTLGQKEFAQLDVLIPENIEEQRKIASILSTWDKVIKLKEKLIEQKKEQKKGLMQKLLTGKLRLPGYDEKWVEVTLESLCMKMRSGGTPKADNKLYYQGEVPFVKVNDITKSGKYLEKTDQTITEAGLNNSSAWIVPKNSLLYSMYASVGFVSINKVEVATNQAIMALVPYSDKVTLEYLYYALEDHKKKVSQLIEASTQGNLNAKLVKNIKIKLPSLNEQKSISSILSRCDQEIKLIQTEVNYLKKQKKGLMQVLLTGKVRVKV